MYAAPLNAPKRVLCWLIGWLNVKFALSPGMVLGQQSDCVCVSLNGSTALYHYRSLSFSLPPVSLFLVIYSSYSYNFS
uniref:Putative secreted peptide n=1 Tax=Anopheles braziliensis TaxID=58242 RepID=A0A2M3ZTD4_9DIPT